MLYEINELCTVDTNNPTGCKEWYDIAINILPKNKNNRFENYFLAISDEAMCCEDYGADKTIPDGEHFVKSIETKVVLPKETFDIDFYSSEEYIATKIITDKGVYYAVVWNIHNGYYSHTIYYSNDELKVDVLETIEL